MGQKRAGLWYGLGIIIVLGLWQLAALAVNLPVVPPPLQVFRNLIDVFYAKIAIHCVYSMWRIVAGVMIAIAAGIPLGYCMGYFKTLDKLLAPVVYLTYPIPKIALLPVIMLLFGLGELSKVLMIFLIIVFQVIIAVRDGVKSIPAETYYPLYSLGASAADIFREILIPATLPNFLTSLRVAMATAIAVLFFTETFGTEYGMGYFIMEAWMRVSYPEMYSGIMVLSLMGLILFGSIDCLEKRLCRWQYK